MISATVISLVAFVLVQAFPEAIVGLFNSSDPELLTIGKQGLRLAMLALPLVGFQVVVGNFFQSVGKAQIATLLTLLRQVIVLIPLLYILPDFLELTGIWISMPIADTCSALIVTYFISREWRKFD